MQPASYERYVMKKLIFFVIVGCVYSHACYYNPTQEELVLKQAVHENKPEILIEKCNQLQVSQTQKQEILNRLLPDAVHLNHFDCGKILLDLGADPLQRVGRFPATIKHVKEHLIQNKMPDSAKKWLCLFAAKYPAQPEIKLFPNLENESAFTVLDAMHSNHAATIIKICKQLNLNEETKKNCLNVFLSDALNNQDLDKIKLLQSVGAQLPSKDVIEQNIKKLKEGFSARFYQERIQFYEEVLKLVN